MHSVGTSIRLDEMAMRHGFNIPSEVRNRIVHDLTAIASDPEMSERHRLAAIKALLEANKQNIDIEKHVVNTALKVYEMGGNPLAAPAEETQATLENASDAELEKLANGNQH